MKSLYFISTFVLIISIFSSDNEDVCQQRRSCLRGVGELLVCVAPLAAIAPLKGVSRLTLSEFEFQSDAEQLLP